MFIVASPVDDRRNALNCCFVEEKRAIAPDMTGLPII